MKALVATEAFRSLPANRAAISVEEGARALGASSGYVRLEIKRGHLRARKRGGRVFILLDDFRRWLEAGE